MFRSYIDFCGIHFCGGKVSPGLILWSPDSLNYKLGTTPTPLNRFILGHRSQQMEPSFTEKPSLKSEKMLFPVPLPLLVSNTEKWQQPRSRTPLDLNTPDTIFVTIFHKGSFFRTNVQIYETWELGLACQGFYFCKVTGRVYFDQLTSCHLNIEYCMPLVEHPSWKHFWRFALGLISTALERVLPGPFHFIAKKAFGLTLEASNRAMTIYFSHNFQLQHCPIFDTIVVICTLIQ